jgi:3-oxoacyl-[acyl-carrier-protein] synthase-3
MAGINILGTGRYIPQTVVNNDDFAAIVDTSDEWITTRTGMKARHIAGPAEPVWLMGREAARLALKAAGVAAGEIGVIIFTSVTQDYQAPSAACIAQRELGAEKAFAFDVAAACAGFAYALDMARRYLSLGDIKYALIISSECNTQLVSYEDRATCVLMGDGAGACVLTAGDSPFGFYARSDISGTGYIYSKRKRRPIPFIDESAPAAEPFASPLKDGLFMNGREVYRFATRGVPEAVARACENAGWPYGDLNLLIPHQANLRIIETALKNMGFPEERCYVNIQEYGNTSSASVAIALDECARSGRLRRGDKLCVVGFGAGLALGACAFEY